MNNSQESVTKFADLHMHSSFSPDARANPQELVDMAIAADKLNVLAITDHNNIEGGLAGAAYFQNHPKKGKIRLEEVIVGSEVTTRLGHVLGLYLTDSISRPPRDLEASEALTSVVAAIHEQGGLVVIAHPFLTVGRSGLGEEGLAIIAASRDPRVYIDGFEVYNAGLKEGDRNHVNVAALNYYEKHPDQLGAMTAGSDGHGWTVGRGLTTFNEDSLKEAILTKKTRFSRLTKDETIDILNQALVLFPHMETERPIHRRARERFLAGD